jgi:magnesium chelatase family protein
MDGRLIRTQVKLESAAVERLLTTVQAAGLTGRGHDRALRLARTIADLEGAREVDSAHVDEALSYRLAEPAAAAA